MPLTAAYWLAPAQASWSCGATALYKTFQEIWKSHKEGASACRWGDRVSMGRPRVPRLPPAYDTFRLGAVARPAQMFELPARGGRPRVLRCSLKFPLVGGERALGDRGSLNSKKLNFPLLGNGCRNDNDIDIIKKRLHNKEWVVEIRKRITWAK